jgi:GNAT superfamily N-acetyltransferase
LVTPPDGALSYDAGVSKPASDLQIRPLTTDRLPDLAALFDEGGDPKTCRCAFWRVAGQGWQDWSKARNQGVLEAVAGRDPAPGLVAYRDGRAVGWVSVGPREDYERLERSRVLARLDDKPVWSIVCFVVSRGHRGQGIARALLDAAVDHARDHGATLVEAYPVDPSRGRVPAAAAFMGPLGMFEQAGFEVLERRQWNATTPVRPIVRRAIRRRRTAGSVRHESR